MTINSTHTPSVYKYKILVYTIFGILFVVVYHGSGEERLIEEEGKQEDHQRRTANTGRFIFAHGRNGASQVHRVACGVPLATAALLFSCPNTYHG